MLIFGGVKDHWNFKFQGLTQTSSVSKPRLNLFGFRKRKSFPCTLAATMLSKPRFCHQQQDIWWTLLDVPRCRYKYDLGGGFKYLIFNPTWGDDPFWRAYFFQMGWSHKLVMHRRTKYSNPGQLHPPMPPTLTFADGGVMPFSSGFEYVVLRYGKSYMKYASQMLLNYFLCRIWWICVHLFVGYVQIYVSILYVNMFIYTYIYKSIYIYICLQLHNSAPYKLTIPTTSLPADTHLRWQKHPRLMNLHHRRPLKLARPTHRGNSPQMVGENVTENSSRTSPETCRFWELCF